MRMTVDSKRCHGSIVLQRGKGRSWPGVFALRYTQHGRWGVGGNWDHLQLQRLCKRILEMLSTSGRKKKINDQKVPPPLNLKKKGQLMSPLLFSFAYVNEWEKIVFLNEEKKNVKGNQNVFRKKKRDRKQRVQHFVISPRFILCHFSPRFFQQEKDSAPIGFLICIQTVCVCDANLFH